MRTNRLTNALFALLAAALVGLALALSGVTPRVLAAPLPVLTASAEPPTATPIPPTATSIPPTATPIPPTATSIPPTATATAPAVATATATTVPTSATGEPPTATASTTPVVDQTAMPTATPIPPTATPIPSTPPSPPDNDDDDGEADPAVRKTANFDSAGLGDVISFSITVTNEGNELAEGVIVEDQLPGFLEYVSASIDRGQVVVSGNTVGFWIGNVEPGEVIRGTIRARVIGFPQGGEGRNNVVLRANNSSDRPQNNQDSVPIRIVQPAESPTVAPVGGEQTPTPTPVPAGVAVPPVAALPAAPPAALPQTAAAGVLPYGLLFLVGVTYMGVGLYLWLRPRRRRR